MTKKINKLTKGLFLLSLSLNTAGSLLGAGKTFEDVKIYRDMTDTKNHTYIDSIEKIVFDDNRVRIYGYSKEDLMHAEFARVTLTNENDYSFLNDMQNLEKLIIDDFRTLPIDEIDGSNFSKDINIIIVNHNPSSSFSKDKYGFLKDIPSIDTLYLTTEEEYASYSLYNDHTILHYINIESEYLESLHNIHSLVLNTSIHLAYNYKDLKFLDRLTLIGEPYTTAIFFSNENLNELKEAGVEVITTNMDTLLDISRKIEQATNNIGVLPTDTEKEKIDKILLYILKEYTYDEEVSKLIKEERTDEIDHSPFYSEGYLDGALNNKTQICGNYAAMFAAMAHSLGLETNLVFNDNHAWDIVKVGEKYYYIDPTILDHTEIINQSVNYVPITTTTMDELGNVKEFVRYQAVYQENGEKISFEDLLSTKTIENFTSSNYMDDITATKDEHFQSLGIKHVDPNVIPYDVASKIENMDICKLNNSNVKLERTLDIPKGEAMINVYRSRIKGDAIKSLIFLINIALISGCIRKNSKDISEEKNKEKTLK